MGKITNIILIMGLFILVNCMPKPPTEVMYTKEVIANNPIRVISIYVDKNFTKTEVEKIQLAIKEWNIALNNNFLLKVVSYGFDMDIGTLKYIYKNNSWAFLKINPDSELFYNTTGKRTLGFVDNVGGNLLYYIDYRSWFNDNRPDEYIEYVFLHEIGHLLMLSHYEEGIMTASVPVNIPTCIDEYTINEIGLKWEIPISSLNYCYYK